MVKHAERPQVPNPQQSLGSSPRDESVRRLVRWLRVATGRPVKHDSVVRTEDGDFPACPELLPCLLYLRWRQDLVSGRVQVCCLELRLAPWSNNCWRTYVAIAGHLQPDILSWNFSSKCSPEHTLECQRHGALRPHGGRVAVQGWCQPRHCLSPGGGVVRHRWALIKHLVSVRCRAEGTARKQQTAYALRTSSCLSREHPITCREPPRKHSSPPRLSLSICTFPRAIGPCLVVVACGADIICYPALEAPNVAKCQ